MLKGFKRAIPPSEFLRQLQYVKEKGPVRKEYSMYTRIKKNVALKIADAILKVPKENRLYFPPYKG